MVIINMDSLKHSLLAGSVFKEFYAGIEFIKITTDTETERYSTKLHDGLNEIPLKQNHHYVDGGIKFADVDNLLDSIKKTFTATYIRKVEIPDDAMVFIDDRDYMADKLILRERIPIGNMEYWNDLSFCEKAMVCDSKLLKFCKNISNEKLLALVKKDPWAFEHIANPTDEMIIIATDRFPYLIRYVKNPSIDLLKKVISKSPYTIRQFDNINPEIVLQLIKEKPEIIEYINQPTYEMCYEAVTLNSKLIKHVPVQWKTKEICDIAFSGDISNIMYLNKAFITFDMALAAVKVNGLYLKCVPDEHFVDEICIEAIKNHARAIDNVKNPTEEMWALAIKKDNSIIYDVKNPTDELLLIAAPKYPNLYDKIKNKDLISDNVDYNKVLEENPNFITSIKNPTYAQWLIAIKKNSRLIKSVPIEFQQEELCMIAVQDYPDGLEYIEQQTDSICLTAVIVKGLTLKFVKKQNCDICNAAIDNDPMALEFAENQSTEAILKALIKNVRAFKFVKQKTDAAIKYAIEKDPDMIEYINDATTVFKYEKEIANALKKKGEAIKHLPQYLQTREMCDNALDNDVYVIKHVNQNFLTEEQAIKIVEKNETLLKEITIQTPKICMASVKKYPFAIQHVHDQTDELCMTAIDRNPNTIMHIKNQTGEMCMKAVSKDYYAMRYITTTDPDIIKFCCIIDPKCVYYVANSIIKAECVELHREIEALY